MSDLVGLWVVFGWFVDGLADSSAVCGWFVWFVCSRAGFWVVSSFTANDGASRFEFDGNTMETEITT